MARFVSKENRPDLKYNPLSYDEITRIPLMLQARDEKAMNDASEVADQYAMIRVPEDHRALKIYNQYGDKLKNQIQSISETLMRNGSLDPGAMSSIRTLKRNYTDTVGVNGTIGRLAEDRNTIDTQRAALQIAHTAQGNRPESFNDIFENQLQPHFSQYDDLLNDPSKPFKTFQGIAPPKRESVENIMARMDKSLGSISSSKTTQTVVANPGSQGITLNYADSSEANSSNERALQAATEVGMMQINDPNSELMISLVYNNPGKTIEELQYEAARELAARVTTRLRTTHQEASGQDIKYVANKDPQHITTDNGQGYKETKDGGEPVSELSYQDTNYEASEEFKDYNELIKIYSGTVEAELESMEQILSSMNPNTPKYKEIENDIKNRKARVASIKFKIAEDMQNNPTYIKDFVTYFKNRDKSTDGVRYENKINHKFKGGNTLEQYLSSESGINTLIKSADNYKDYFQKDPELSQAFNLIKANSAHAGKEISFFADNLVPNKTEVIGHNVPNATRTFASKRGKSYYSGKEGVRKYLSDRGIKLTGAKFDNFYQNYIAKAHLDYGVSVVNNNFISKNYGPDKGEIGIASNRIVIPNSEVKAKYDKDINALGGTTIINEFNGNKNNYFYESESSKPFIKSIDAQEDSNLKDFLNSAANSGTFEFDSIIERGAGKNSTVMLKASVKGGDKTVTKLMGIDINAKNTAQGKSANTILIDKLINMTSGVDRSRLIAIRDNARYDNIYVDTPEIGPSGVSEHQNKQMKTYISGSRVANDSNYKKASPILTAKKSNIVAHKSGFHSFNYQDESNQTKSLTLGQFFIKDKMYDEMENGTFSTKGLTNESDISRLYYNPNDTTGMNVKAVEFIRSIQNMAQLIERVDTNNTRTSGVIRIEDINKTNQFMSAYDEMKNLSNTRDINALLNIAKGMYQTIKDVPLMHRNKLKGI